MLQGGAGAVRVGGGAAQCGGRAWFSWRSANSSSASPPSPRSKSSCTWGATSAILSTAAVTASGVLQGRPRRQRVSNCLIENVV